MNQNKFCSLRDSNLSDEVIKNNSILYYRFHGVPTLYKSKYIEKFIKEITEEIKTSGRFKDAYIYFNNTWVTGALSNAKQLQDFIS